MEREPERGRKMEADLQGFLAALKPLPAAGERRGGDA
jgi:hypothetical protein